MSRQTRQNPIVTVRDVVPTLALDPASGRIALDASPRDNVIYASAEGILADAGTDVSTSLAALITSAPSGSTIQLQGGTYNVAALRGLVYNNSVTVRGVPGKTKLVGNGSITLGNYISDIMIRIDSGSIRFQHLSFENTGTPIGMKGLMELGDIEFDDCSFSGCTGVVVEVYDPTGITARLAAGKQLSWRNFRMTNCDVYDCELGVILRTDGGYDSVIVSDTVFNGVGWAGVWVGTEYGLSVDRTVFQYLQSRVTVHDCIFRGMRLSAYADIGFFVNVQVNAVVALGQAVTIHDNLIENINNTEIWDDCEAIYTKGRYFDIHDNILVNAGGSEAAIMVKGVAFDQSTTLAAAMDGLSLPQSTITVASTEGWLNHNPAVTALAVETSAGMQIVTFTGRTATTFTGCTGGTGVMSTGGDVRGEISITGSMTGVSGPGKIHHNTLVFTRTDVAQAGITSTIPGLEISDNLIDGATNRAITITGWAPNCIVKNNRIINHHGDYGIVVGSSHTLVEGNVIEQIDGSFYPLSTSIRAFYVIANYTSITGIVLRNNVVFNRLEADGTRSAASEKLRFVHIQAINPLTGNDIRVIGNKARNISISVNVTVDGPISDLLVLDNDFQNEDDTAVTQAVTHASPRTVHESSVLRGASGTPRALGVTPVVSQSGTAGYTALLVDVTEAAVGSGSKYLIDARLGGTSYWSVDNAGRMRVPLGPIELGNASDTTIARSAAGRITVEGAEVITATAVAALAAKTTPVDADIFALFDSAASGAPKSLTLANLKAAIVALIVGAAPATMDTLDEIALALADDANYAATMTAALALKAPLASPTFTGAVKGVPYDITYVQTVTTRAVGLGSNIIGVRMMRACQITTVAYRCVGADASGNLVVELRKNGAQIATSVATIAAANQTTATVVSSVNTSFAVGDILTVQITGVGTTPGTGLYADIAAVTV